MNKAGMQPAGGRGTLFRLAGLLVVLQVLVGCATAREGQRISDPLEPFNRAMFEVNATVDKYLFRPIAIGYREITPSVVRSSIRNVFSLVRKPLDFANSLLQGDFTNAGEVLAATVINATAGVGGLFDVAGEFGITPREEDFGQTLGTWGAGPGPYLVLPFLGPSTLRDTLAFPVDYTMDPLTWALGGHALVNQGRGLTGTAGENASVYLSVTDGISAREEFLDPLDELSESSLDLYATLRSLTLQRRQGQIRNVGDSDNGDSDSDE